MRIRTTALLFFSVVTLAGCYSRQPLRTDVPPPNTRVVATVTDTGSVLLGNDLGPGVVELEGLVSAATPQQWTLHMLRVELRDGRQVSWNRELVNVPRVAVTAPQTVVLDRTRSWLAAGGIVVGSFLVARAFGLQFGGDEDDGSPGGPPPIEFTGRGRR